jgi:hypothetical protein
VPVLEGALTAICGTGTVGFVPAAAAPGTAAVAAVAAGWGGGTVAAPVDEGAPAGIRVIGIVSIAPA